MAWVSPTGYNDPDSKWGNEANAYDEDTDTFAYDFPNGYYLELTLGSAISCDKVRIFAERYTSSVSYDLDADVDVYYSGAWHNIHSGTITKNTWVELPIGSTQVVDKARIKTNTATASRRIKEFEFNEVAGGQTYYGAATLSGAGALATLAKLTVAAKATLAGEASLAAAAVKVLTGATTLAGEGALAAIATIEGAIKYGTATVSGAGTLTALGRKFLSAATSLAGTGSLAAAGVTVLTGASTLAGTGSLAASAALTHGAKALMEGTGSLSAVGSLLGDVFGAVTLAGQGSLSIKAESWHILTSEEYQDLLGGQIEFQEI